MGGTSEVRALTAWVSRLEARLQACERESARLGQQLSELGRAVVPAGFVSPDASPVAEGERYLRSVKASVRARPAKRGGAA